MTTPWPPSEELHVPILLHEVLELLAVRPGGRYIDATANGGGHTRAILDACGPDGRVLALDRDADLIERLAVTLADFVGAARLVPINTSFDELATVAAQQGFSPCDGVLFDLGLSSYHLDHSARGFAFARSEPLDMRFGPDESDTGSARELLERASTDELTRIFRELGEERFASRIARTIVSLRDRHPITTTNDLFEAVARSLPANTRWRAARHAARIFQAVRIAVNDELDAVRAALPQAWECLAPGGRIAVLSFHSLEDRIVKHFFREQARRGGALLTKKPLTASADEVARNPRAASAKLRAVEKR
jgi:16S rRNA (cytosine1402-N4)-methyltransferase